MLKRFLRNALILSLCAAAGTAGAATPRDVANLVGEGSRAGESELRSRGYVHIETQKDWDRSWSMWWNQSTHTCITVAIDHGRFDAITTSPATDCNQYHAGGENNDDAVAALAIGAAAVIGAIALSHKSHHHDNNTHYDDNHNESEFERGHRDGLYDHFFENYNNTEAYADGYRSGVEQREHNSSYRVHSGRHDRGYTRSHNVNDLKNLNGDRVSDAHSSMSRWGFRQVDTLYSGNTTYTIWYKRASGQCIQMTEANGRALDVSDIGFNPACR